VTDKRKAIKKKTHCFEKKKVFLFFQRFIFFKFACLFIFLFLFLMDIIKCFVLIGTTKRELQHLNNYHISTVERKDWIMCVLLCLTRANNQRKKKDK